METFVGYFLFWFYFFLIMLGVALSTVCAIIGGIIAYDSYKEDTLFCIGGICAVLVGTGSLIGCMVLSKFVLNPIFRSLPDLF